MTDVEAIAGRARRRAPDPAEDSIRRTGEGSAAMHHAAANEKTLQIALVAGDHATLRRIYDRHAAPMYGLARRVLRDDHLAEEIVQEVMLRLWTEPERWDPTRGALRSFLYRETHSRAIERIRSEEARRRREERDRQATTRETDHEDVEREAWAMIRSELVREALLRLSAAERQVIELAYFGGHTYRDVAAMLELPEGTVKSRIRLGLAKLADALRAAGLEPTP